MPNLDLFTRETGSIETINPDDFIELITPKADNTVKIEYAKVVAFDKHGNHKLHFVGNKNISGMKGAELEEELSRRKTYNCLNSYTPKVGDRVMIINNIIIGRN